jgi:hypothetical protein
VLAKLIGIVVILILGAFVFSCARGGCSFPTSSQGSPQAVVKSAIQSIPDRDIAKVTAYITGPAQTVTSTRLQALYQHFDSIKLGSVLVSLQSQQDAIAHVYLKYDLLIGAGSQTTTQKIELTVQVVNLDGEWYVNEPIL